MVQLRASYANFQAVLEFNKIVKASNSVQLYSRKANPPCQMAYTCVVEPV